MLEDKMSGIYKITNLFNGHFYIGSSSNLEKRFKEHWRLLKSKKHINSHLQRSVNKYGLEYFTFEIIDYCNEEDLLKQEQFYIDTLEPDYNILKLAGNSIGYKHTDETKVKLSKLKVGKKLSEETRRRMSEATKGHQNSLGIKHTEETKKRMSESHIGSKRSDETKKKMSEAQRGSNHPMYGRLGSDNPKSKKVIQLTKDGEFVNEFYGTREAGRQTNINNSDISKACKGKAKSAGGYLWRYA